MLNELEWVKGEIFANVWQTNYIVRIDPKTGAVTGVIDLSSLVGQELAKGRQIDVLNGIAYDAEHDRLFVTGEAVVRPLRDQADGADPGRGGELRQAPGRQQKRPLRGQRPFPNPDLSGGSDPLLHHPVDAERTAAGEAPSRERRSRRSPPGRRRSGSGTGCAQGVGHEIGDRHLAGDEEGHRAGEQADHDQDAADQFDPAGRSRPA